MRNKFYQGTYFKFKNRIITYFVTHNEHYTNKYGKPLYIVYLRLNNFFDSNIILKYELQTFKDFKNKLKELKSNLHL